MRAHESFDVHVGTIICSIVARSFSKLKWMIDVENDAVVRRQRKQPCKPRSV